ncbi:uncharacterized protein LOC143018042 [Oratosquilla oratoria]|uniref:uncharacterized protein LOC143018042 n=1 Tax=Oratosquilla oratoria TaxID=337810 RepID=UPI003F76CBD6
MTRWLARVVLAIALIAIPTPAKKCVMPAEWRGEWFHSGVYSPVVINEDSISFKGRCHQADRDRYILKSTHFDCYRCLVIHQKHHNVLQYKETYCDRRESLETLCRQLTGDALLYSMFRLDTEPVACPFPHTFFFTYNRGYGDCSYPVSTVDSCTEDWRLLFRYQACPDVQGTESTTEELECLATWKDGSNRFLVGKSNHPLATSDEDRYRCFVYDSWSHDGSSGFQVAMSGDATCNGLFSVNYGSRTLRLTKVDSSKSSCTFPTWVGGPHWHSLDGHTTLHITHHNSTLRVAGRTGGPVTHFCLRQVATTPTSGTYVTRVMQGCTSGYQCVYLLNRDTHVLELIMGETNRVAEEACSHHFFNVSSTNFTTFVSGGAVSRTCPGMGRYEVTGGAAGSSGVSSLGSISSVSSSSNSGGSISGSSTTGGVVDGGASVGGADALARRDPCETARYTTLSVGCSSTDTLEIHTTCSHSVYSCHGWWEEAGRQYLVVTPTSRSSKGVRRLCLVLDRTGNVLSLASSSRSCRRDLTPGLHGHIALNTTKKRGGCKEILMDSSGSSVTSSPLDVLLVVLLTLITTYSSALSFSSFSSSSTSTSSSSKGSSTSSTPLSSSASSLTSWSTSGVLAPNSHFLWLLPPSPEVRT